MRPLLNKKLAEVGLEALNLKPPGIFQNWGCQKEELSHDQFIHSHQEKA